MEGYLLDTNICIHYFKGKYNLINKIREIGPENCYISEITLAELMYGAANSADIKRHKEEVDGLLEWLTVLPIRPVLWTFANNKSLLRRTGQPIDDFDLLIGTTAAYYDMIMVTENVKHLNHVPNLTIENWIEK